MPFGPWHPDASAPNTQACVTASGCRPAVNGYLPFLSMASATSALDGQCLGAAVVFYKDGSVHHFAGDASKLYKLGTAGVWADVTRASGGLYSSGSGARWQFGFSGGLAIACTIGETPQKYLIGSSTKFADLGGSPPKASFIATVRDFVVLGGLNGDLMTVAWSGLGDPEWWTVGTNSCDTQTFQSGGPIRGLLGGEVGYVFQAGSITRMSFVPGSDLIFQFDTVEDGRGLAAPFSLVRIGSLAFFLSSDGFYRFDVGSGRAEPIGTGKWTKWVMADMNPGLMANVVGSVDPTGRFVIWAYPTLGASGTTLNRCLIYDWTLDEATTVDITVTALAQMLTQGVTLDTMDSFGTLDELPFSLDAPIWSGGASLLGAFSTDKTMSYFAGQNMAASWVTNDIRLKGRIMIRGVRPHIEAPDAVAALAMREAEQEAVTFGVDESNDDSGNISTWGAGNFGRIRIKAPAGSSWSKMTGAELNVTEWGSR